MRKRSIALLAAALLVIAGAGAESISPTTGLALPGEPVSPVLAPISHSERTQPWGAQNADVIYESLLANNGATRMTYLFHDALVNGVQVEAGPVRSIRESHVALAREWQGTLLYTGTTAGNRRAAPGVMELQSPFFSMQDSRVRAYGSRLQPQQGRRHKAPENLSVDVSGVFGLTREPFAARGFRFGNGESYQQHPPASEIRLDWGHADYICTYIYEETQNVYLRFNGKTPAMTWYGSMGEEQMQQAFQNVIIQFVEYEWLNGSAWLPLAQLEGEGKAIVFTGGRVIEGSWKNDGHTLFLDENGEEILLSPGHTYIAHFPLESGKWSWN